MGYHFGDFELAQQMGNLLIKAGLDKGHFFACSQFGYLALTHLALARNASPRRQWSLLREANKHIAVLNKMAKAKNLNVDHILHLCIAERAALKSDADMDEVKAHYSKAIRECLSQWHSSLCCHGKRASWAIPAAERRAISRRNPFLRALELYSYWGAPGPRRSK
jgi:hypothetical protein